MNEGTHVLIQEAGTTFNNLYKLKRLQRTHAGGLLLKNLNQGPVAKISDAQWLEPLVFAEEMNEMRIIIYNLQFIAIL